MEQLPEVVALDQRNLGGLWSLSGYQREIESPNSDLLVLQQVPHTALGEDSPPPPILGVGCAWAILEECHITLLAIDQPYRGQGLGQALLFTLLNCAHQRQLERATLEVRPSNAAALQLYRKFGFRDVGRRRHYYSDGEDGLILWRGGLQLLTFQMTLQEMRPQIDHHLQQHNWQLISTMADPP